MVRTVFTLAVTTLLCLSAADARPAVKAHAAAGTPKSTKKHSAKKTSNTSTKGSSSSSAKGSSTKKGAGTAHSAKSHHGKKTAVKAAPVKRGQQAPEPERIKEIQQALIERGFLQGEPTGVWGADSVEALRRFQEDKKLQANGKLSSLSLIHLGLGPKREVPAPQRTEQQQP